jgi:hypothetical protein
MRADMNRKSDESIKEVMDEVRVGFDEDVIERMRA